MDRDSEALIKALRSMPTPEPRPGFVDRVLANEARAAIDRAAKPRPGQLRSLKMRWDAWIGTLGVATATALVLLVLRSLGPDAPAEQGIALALNEMRDIDVLVESERDLEGATIRIAVTGGAVLNGFENEHEIDWQANLKRGANILSLPVVARSAGSGQLVAVIEHEGRTRRMAISLTVSDAGASRT